MGKFVPGQVANPKGRPKGSSNKTTTSLKEAILEAANAAHPGGIVGYLTDRAMTDPGPFMALLGKVLPLTLEGNKDAPLELNFTDEARARALAAFIAKTKAKT